MSLVHCSPPHCLGQGDRSCPCWPPSLYLQFEVFTGWCLTSLPGPLTPLSPNWGSPTGPLPASLPPLPQPSCPEGSGCIQSFIFLGCEPFATQLEAVLPPWLIVGWFCLALFFWPHIELIRKAFSHSIDYICNSAPVGTFKEMDGGLLKS